MGRDRSNTAAALRLTYVSRPTHVATLLAPAGTDVEIETAASPACILYIRLAGVFSFISSSRCGAVSRLFTCLLACVLERCSFAELMRAVYSGRLDS